MPRNQISPNAEVARRILDELWNEVMAEDALTTRPEYDKLIDSRGVAIRYALPTQLLGKATDAKLDCLCLQKRNQKGNSAWDPRSFSKKVTAPWVIANQKVLGTSVEPYVGNPLRVPRLQSDPGPVKDQDDWIGLYKILHEVQEKNDPMFTLDALRWTLRSIKRKLAENTFEFVIPERVSLEQTRQTIGQFLKEGSGGDRGLAVAAALFQTFGKFLGLYSKVTRHMINASDASTGATADIECFDVDGNLKLAVEVKERSLTLTDVKAGLIKARKESVQGLLFNSPTIKAVDAEEIAELFDKTWASGTNLYQLSIDELIKVGLTLTGEAGRKDFLENVGIQLNEFNTQPKNRQRWKQFLEEV